MLIEQGEPWWEGIHRDMTPTCDFVHTVISALEGEKQLILMPPGALGTRLGEPSMVGQPGGGPLPECLDEGWPELLKRFRAAGAREAILPGQCRFVHIPEKWWHIVRPGSDLTVSLSTSLRGSAATWPRFISRLFRCARL